METNRTSPRSLVGENAEMTGKRVCTVQSNYIPWKDGQRGWSTYVNIQEQREYLTGPKAASYLDESVFAEEGIRVRWMDYGRYKEYGQLFIHGVSMLDLILNENIPSLREYMLSFEHLLLTLQNRAQSYVFQDRPY